MQNRDCSNRSCENVSLPQLSTVPSDSLPLAVFQGGVMLVHVSLAEQKPAELLLHHDLPLMPLMPSKVSPGAQVSLSCQIAQYAWSGWMMRCLELSQR